MTLAAGQINAANTVTLNGSSTLTLFGNNAFANLLLNNNGGTAPVVNTGGVLSLASGSVTANSNSVYQSSTVSTTSALDFGAQVATFNVAPVLVGGQNVAPLLATLNMAGGIRGTAGLNVTGQRLSGMAAAQRATQQQAQSRLDYYAQRAAASAARATATGNLINQAGGLAYQGYGVYRNAPRGSSIT